MITPHRPLSPLTPLGVTASPSHSNSNSNSLSPSTPLGVTASPVFLLLLLALLLSSCKGVEDIRLTGVSDFEFKGMENNVISFSAKVGVSNPSAVGFRVTGMNIKTLADGNFIGTLSTPDHVKIKARSDSAYFMNFTLTLPNMLTGASSLYSLARKKKVNMEMQGVITARSWLTTRKTEIHESRTIDVPAFNR